MDPAISPSLRADLDAVRLQKGPSYVARTRHKDASGTPKYTNRLIRESSPYLLQHAHNPVNWFPWGDEAFAMARATGRPVFLSIGYSTCHWCHVMEEESFEDVEVATYLNEHYIAIKVDREERPDVDSVYMTAVQMLTGRGGWPMSSWLTPDREPFFAGTYFPARDGDRGTRQGFLTLLKVQVDLFLKDPKGVAEKASAIAAKMRDAAEPQGSPALSAPVPAAPALLDAAEAAMKRYDPDQGGARGAPKFPSSFPIRLLLRHARRTGSEASLSMATTTLRKMAAGGIYDHVGGGFHRYSTDARWLVPHFEKMLYDNATLATTYVEAYQATGDADFARVARETLDYVLREMTSPEGGFYSATDADSKGPSGEREEGYFFTWTEDEIDAAVSEEQARVVTALYAVTKSGNFEGRTIFSTPRPRDEVAKSLTMTPEALDLALGEAILRLRETRAKRPPPLRDDKIQVSWNGLMVSALSRAAFALDEPRYREAAEKAANFMLTKMREGGRLHHSYKDGATSAEAFLDDYASLSVALCDLFELTHDARFLSEAAATMETLEAGYADPERGGYFLTSNDHEKLLMREKPDSDGPSPSGNTLALEALLRLGELTTEDKYRARSERLLRAFSEPLRTRPWSLDEMLVGVDFHSDRPKEIVIVTAGAEGKEGSEKALVDEVRKAFLPNRALVIATEEELRGPLGEAVPWAKDKPAKGGLATAYVCEAGSCKLPVTDARGLRKQLREVVRYE